MQLHGALILSCCDLEAPGVPVPGPCRPLLSKHQDLLGFTGSDPGYSQHRKGNPSHSISFR